MLLQVFSGPTSLVIEVATKRRLCCFLISMMIVVSVISASDTIGPKVLLSHLQHLISVIGATLQWLPSFFPERHQKGNIE